MKHKPNLLLIGFPHQNELDSLESIHVTKCDIGKEALELVIAQNYDLIICKFKTNDTNVVELNQSLNSVKNYYSKISPKTFKFLVITSSLEEEKICKINGLLYYPESLNLKSLVLKLIDLPQESKRNEKKIVVIDFKELFIRVDNNREFIQSVMEKFFEIRESRIQDIRTPLSIGELKKAKDAAHKLKGVLANFSMLEARLTISELEELILNNDLTTALEKLQQLSEDIDRAKQFYLNNIDLFKTKP